MDLSNKEIELLRQAQNKSSVPIEEKDYDYLSRLADKKLIRFNIILDKDATIIPKSYFLTSEGKYQLELLDTHKQHERKLNIWYPTIVNCTYGVIGFIVGWIVKSLIHFPLFH